MVEIFQEIDVGIGLKGIGKALEKLDGLELFVGFDGPEAQAVHTPGGKASVALIAFWTEFGAKEFQETGILPPRPFMELALAENQDKIATWYTEAIGRILDGKDAETEMGKMGAKVVELVRAKIDTAASWADALSEPYASAKTGPMLRETDKMRSTIGWFVRKGEAIVRSGK